MTSPSPIYISTARVAQLACVEKHVILQRMKRDKCYSGVFPRKAATGQWLWPAAEIYKALGIFAASLPAAQGLQDRAVESTGADVFAAHQIAAWQHQTSRRGPTSRTCIDEMFDDLADVRGLLAACRARTGHALNHEDEMSAADWQRANDLAIAFERESEALTRMLRWRSPASSGAAA